MGYNKSMTELLIFNSYYRSANVFSSFLAGKMIGCNITTNHDPNLYSDKTKKQVVFFRNPYDCIPSLIVKRRVDSDVDLPTYSDLAGINNDVISAAQQYIHYIEKAKENFDNLYVGHFETYIQDPISEFKKIAKFFDLPLIPVNDTFENIYEQIEKQMFNQPGPLRSEHLMTPHDGHMPREKIEARLVIEEYVKNCDDQIVKDCYNLYLNMQYTKI